MCIRDRYQRRVRELAVEAMSGIALPRAKPSIVNVQVHHANRAPSSGIQLTRRTSATEASVRNLLESPLESRLMSARDPTAGLVVRNATNSPYERPQIGSGPEHKRPSFGFVDLKSQSVHHEPKVDTRASYTEQVAAAYNSDRRIVPNVQLDEEPPIKSEFTTIMKDIREPIDQKLYDVEMELKAAQERGDTFKMNVCRDQINQLEKQFLYFKKNSMKLLMQEHLGKSKRQERMEGDWYRSWQEFRVEVETEKVDLADQHQVEMKQFKDEIFNVAKTASELTVSDRVHDLRREVSALVQAGRVEEAKAKREEANRIALHELQGQSPFAMLRDKNLEQRMAALALKQRQDNQEFERKVESRAVGLATWRCGMEQVDK
eukprot:TRINITY_DN44178_c0_g1_i1.p1 TRINITY_DN44178_c0_g1~~TRINITY_DN44178_c0_g1_i1.p1  ORF type:complete len:376 (-),score=100.69 TRINITY_DN44178_c0_g1_i1:66-1193(-)